MKFALMAILGPLLLGHPPPANLRPARECRWVIGRLSAFNGTPSFRIWPRGTNRLLGVIGRSGGSEGPDILPASVARMGPSFHRDLWGGFRVCPQTPARVGWMRMVIVTDGLSLSARER